jgi:hypothetical protein
MTLQTAPFPKPPHGAQAGPLARIAIIGRGFTGIMNAIALLKGFDLPFHLVMFDPNPRINGGEGVSRSTKTVLNSRVRDLSVDPAVQADFKHWLEADEEWRQEASREGVDHSFVSGETFSAYVYQRFSEALRQRIDVVVRLQSEAVGMAGFWSFPTICRRRISMPCFWPVVTASAKASRSCRHSPPFRMRL